MMIHLACLKREMTYAQLSYCSDIYILDYDFTRISWRTKSELGKPHFCVFMEISTTNKIFI